MLDRNFRVILWTSANLKNLEKNRYRIILHKRSLPQFVKQEIEINGKINGTDQMIHKIIIDKKKDISIIKSHGETAFLVNENSFEYKQLIGKIYQIKKNVIDTEENDNDTIRLLINEVNKLEEIRNIFLDWFENNRFIAPEITIENPIIIAKWDSLFSSGRWENENVKIEQSTHSPELPLNVQDFTTLQISIPKDIEYKDLIAITLIGDGLRTKDVQISQHQAAFLMFLAMERDQKGQDWLSKPDEHIDSLKEIYGKLALKSSILDEINDEKYDKIVWFKDFKNVNRKRYVNQINKSVRDIGNIDGKLVVLSVSIDPAKTGNYKLSENIRKIIFK